ncbi:hypothetical protein NQ317_007716 [Molorchus minor]|uniref:Uncharacterized protein n=1 Tax=Molorchus minor TaxID=1323400 RepID=A0ABQ9IQP4_9CUCU|nr:hypothetical protein NQ317_007716 [Molorchus minor]
MKAFKSLQAYKYFESGFVLKTGTKLVNDCYILLGKRHAEQTEACEACLGALRACNIFLQSTQYQWREPCKIQKCDEQNPIESFIVERAQATFFAVLSYDTNSAIFTFPNQWVLKGCRWP